MVRVAAAGGKRGFARVDADGGEEDRVKFDTGSYREKSLGASVCLDPPPVRLPRSPKTGPPRPGPAERSRPTPAACEDFPQSGPISETPGRVVC